MARASIPTLLSLDRFARIIGLNPVHFAGAQTPGINPAVFPLKGCSGIWFQYDWQQSDRVSREQVAKEIKHAEDEIASVIGFYPAPMWISEERATYMHSQPADGSYQSSLTVRGNYKSVGTAFRKVKATGRRALALVGTANSAAVPVPTLAYSDADGDGFFELATITLAIPAGLTATVTDRREVKFYFAGHSGDPEWEIRPEKTKAIAAGVITATFDSWLLIDPDLWEVFPVEGGLGAIDISTTANFVTTVEVYREYTDHVTQANFPARFQWEMGTVCSCTDVSECSLGATQPACLFIRDAEAGILVPVPSLYDAATAKWNTTTFAECIEPEGVDLWYYAGDVDNRYRASMTTDPLSDWWAYTIAYLAASRLDRPICDCGNTQSLIDKLQVDLIETLAYNLHGNPFGTRRGEVLAWSRISKMARKVGAMAI